MRGPEEENNNSSAEPKASNNEEWLKLTIGNIGKWQCWISFLLSLFKFPLAWIQMSIVFLAPATQFWCTPPIEYQTMKPEEWIDFSKPFNETITNFDPLNKGNCYMRSFSDSSKEITTCPYGYDYNRTIFQTSIITEWNLICGKERLVDVSQIILMLGILVGNIVFGLYADRYGRKIILVICIVIQTVFAFLASWSPWFWGFVLSRFLVAVANGGTLVVSFVMCIEIVGGKWRSIIPILIQAPFGLGYSLMAVFAYYIRDWRQFHFVISALSAIFICYIWLIPESPRWLFVKGRQSEGRQILEAAAKCNGIGTEEFNERFEKLHNFPVDVKKPSFKDLFSTPTLTKRTIWLCTIWLFSGMSFFTITQYVGHVGQNIFLSTIAGGLVSLPGQFICLYMIAKCGRRNTIAFWTFISAVCFMSIIAFPKGAYPHDWQRMVFCSIAILGISVSLCAIYLFTGELLPTVVRNTGMGLCSVCLRIGSMVAPLVISLHDILPFLPLLLLGLFNLIQALLTIMLPETKGKLLPELISDVEERKSHPKSFTEYVKVETKDEKEMQDLQEAA